MFELKHLPEFPQEIIATDEVGRGPLSGPVVIGAIRLKVEDKESLDRLLKWLRPKGVKDSKKLEAQDRAKVLKKLGILPAPFRQVQTVTLKGIEITYVTWELHHDVIDDINILAASLLGMREAATTLSQEKNKLTTVFIDGHMKLRWGKRKSPWTEIPVIKGDSKSVLIGLASIIAKEKRDAYMKEMHELYPHYGFNTNAGYPTKEHKKAIREHGPSPIHRRTFQGVKEYCSEVRA